MPVVKRPPFVTGLDESFVSVSDDRPFHPLDYLIAGLGPDIPPDGFAVGCRSEVPGTGA